MQAGQIDRAGDHLGKAKACPGINLRAPFYFTKPCSFSQNTTSRVQGCLWPGLPSREPRPIPCGPFWYKCRSNRISALGRGLVDSRQGSTGAGVGWIMKKKHTASSLNAVMMAHRNSPRSLAIYPGAIL